MFYVIAIYDRQFAIDSVECARFVYMYMCTWYNLKYVIHNINIRHGRAICHYRFKVENAGNEVRWWFKEFIHNGDPKP